MKEKFSYQFVFSLSDDWKHLVSFSGETDLSLKEILDDCLSNFNEDVSEDLDNYPLIHCVYQPIKFSNNGTQEKT